MSKLTNYNGRYCEDVYQSVRRWCEWRNVKTLFPKIKKYYFWE